VTKPLDLKDCTLFVLDGTGTNFIAIRIGEGSLSYTVSRNVEARKSRGQLYQSREGEEEPTEISFQFVWDSITSSGDEPPTLEEALYGLAEGWTSASAADPNGPWTTNLQIVRSFTCRSPKDITTNDGDTYNFPEFNLQKLAHSAKDATVDCSGFSNRVRPTVTRP
jgi:hypothetical protein